MPDVPADPKKSALVLEENDRLRLQVADEKYARIVSEANLALARAGLLEPLEAARVHKESLVMLVTQQYGLTPVLDRIDIGTGVITRAGGPAPEKPLATVSPIIGGKRQRPAKRK